MRKFFILGITLITCLAAHAQNFLSWQLNDRYFSVQAGAGFASYRGELKHNGSIQNEVSNLNLAIEARLWSKVSARLLVGNYAIRGHDKHAPDSSWARQRNLSFYSRNLEAALQGVFYLRSYRGDYYKRWKLDPYVALGVGFTTVNPMADLGNESYALYDIATEDASYSRLTVILPAAAGLKWKVNPYLNFITEVAFRYTFSDYLDDVSGQYPTSYPNTTAELLSNRKDEIGVVNEEAYESLTSGMPRGDHSDKDAYLFLNLKLEYYLPPGLFSKN
ncbi:hypothetical protein [Marinoscillum furvescens]|nr:hypothetical protein [Marinoscillum furvescens]